MHAGRNYTLKQVLIWTRGYIYRFVLISLIPVLLYELLGLDWLSIPWLPMALVGTAVAFLIGFKNNTSYERQWEARKIWGAIVNASRSRGIMVKDFVTKEHADEAIPDTELFRIKRQIIYRHIAWLFILLLPMGMISEFSSLGEYFVWLTVPFATLISWVFHTMDRIGEASENPFEGNPNDIPITTLSRTIEIDLRGMLDETELPEPLVPVNDIMM